ncbi:GTPase ObgE [Candidatus Peregrinibacteria bacterium]|nr:GTPase ObgE [Candidatus Peregrinibacteria bacterium]MBT7736122.1 GTPase ObgE [Candidatus Peregrinibacteria bacterium]
MFCDELKIKLKAGKGGDGCVSFRREKFVPKGGPDGGDGGHGGHIIIKVNSNLNTLGHLTNGKKYKGEDGGSGKGKNMHGKNAETLLIEVPRGTIVLNEDKSQAIADLGNEGEQIVIAKGGQGGLGNSRFKSSTHQAPRFAETGEPGEEMEIVLELKLVADVGLIGLPSAGKSTLISVISNARPKIAAYHFTTLTPNLGVVNIDKNNGFVVADIPGLIEGASEGKGLGHQFLKHISRTKLLVHIIDGSLDDIAADFKTITKELKDFDKSLAKKEQIVVINKLDIIDDDDIKKKIKDLKKASKKTKIFTISGVTHEGLQPLLREIVKKLEEIRKEEASEPKKKEEVITIHKPHLDQVKFEIEKVIKKKDHKIFKIKGKRIEQLLIMTDTKNPEGLERVYHFFDKMGIKSAIEKKGATFGDIVKIKEKNIPYRK